MSWSRPTFAARGLDNLDVGHVVQFDFAKERGLRPSCGRTARAGYRGEVTSLVTKSDTELVRALRDAQKRGADLIAAGEQQQREAKQRAATELQPQASGPYRGKDAPMPSAAAFPDCRGISSHEEVGEAVEERKAARVAREGAGQSMAGAVVASSLEGAAAAVGCLLERGRESAGAAAECL